MSLNRKVQPVRPYRRFVNSKQADTGIDPQGSYHRFVIHDPIKNLDVNREHTKIMKSLDPPLVPNGKVPYGTTKCTYKLGLSLDGRLDRTKLAVTTK